MAYDSFFNSEENKTLLAICTRKLINKIGLGGVAWGMLVIIGGLAYMEQTFLHLGLVILGILMLVSGLYALIRPSLGVLLLESIVAVLIFCWNSGMALSHYLDEGGFDPFLVIVSLVVAIAIASYYLKLGHLKKQIASVQPDQIKAATKMCSQLAKKKLKKESLVLEAKKTKCCLQLRDEKALFIQRNLSRAFWAGKDEVRQALAVPEAKRLQLNFVHPLGKLKYKFDLKNSAQLKDWLGQGDNLSPDCSAG